MKELKLKTQYEKELSEQGLVLLDGLLEKRTDGGDSDIRQYYSRFTSSDIARLDIKGNVDNAMIMIAVTYASATDSWALYQLQLKNNDVVDKDGLLVVKINDPCVKFESADEFRECERNMGVADPFLRMLIRAVFRKA